MKKPILLIFGFAASFCFGFLFKTLITKDPVINVNVEQKTDNLIIMKKVTGIAGIFFKCKDPKKIKDWYKTHLGFATDQYGARFEWQEGADTTKKGSIQWSPFSEKTTYFDPSTKDFMINYSVANLADLVEQLRKEGVTIVDQIETYEYGKFVHIMDIEGNKIELYEPNSELLTSSTENNCTLAY